VGSVTITTGRGIEREHVHACGAERLSVRFCSNACHGPCSSGRPHKSDEFAAGDTSVDTGGELPGRPKTLQFDVAFPDAKNAGVVNSPPVSVLVLGLYTVLKFHDPGIQ